MSLKIKIVDALKLNRIEVARKLATLLLQEEHNQAWYVNKQSEYSALYPSTRVMSVEEKTLYDEQFTVDNPKPISYDNNGVEIPFKYPVVDITYISTDADGNEVRTPSDYLTYDEWLNEVNVITPEVLEVISDDPITGMATITTPYQPAVTELVRPYIPLEVTDIMVEERLLNIPEYNAFVKTVKLENKEKVTVANNQVRYQGDPMSINYMSAVGAVAAMRMFQKLVITGVISQADYDAIYKTQQYWKGADNKIHQVEVESVVDTCELAMLEQAKVIGV